MDMGKGAPALRPAAGAARLKSEGDHMVNYLIKRTLFALLLVLVVATIVFGIVRLAPGDPAIVILGDAASQESIEALHEEMGLNQPLWRQYAVFMGNLAQLDLGDSMINGVPVLDQLEVALPYTLELTTAGMILGVVLGIPLGVICALYRNRIPDYLGRVLSLGGISIPSFYLSILLLYAFAVKCQWFPVVNLSTDGSIAARLYNLVLPMTTQGLIMTSFIMRMARSSLLNVLGEDYVRTARGKGLPERLVIFRHALINALIPVVSVIGIYFVINLGSSVMTEIVFSRPGLGKLMVLAMKQRDYVMLQSVMIVYAFLAIFINFAVDMAYALIDPRISSR